MSSDILETMIIASVAAGGSILKKYFEETSLFPRSLFPMTE